MKNWIKRAIRTFIQAALGYLVVAVPAIDFNDNSVTIKTALIGAGVAAMAAGIAAVMNIIDEKKDG